MAPSTPLSQMQQNVLELTQLAGLDIREDAFLILWELMQSDVAPMPGLHPALVCKPQSSPFAFSTFGNLHPSSVAVACADFRPGDQIPAQEGESRRESWKTISSFKQFDGFSTWIILNCTIVVLYRVLIRLNGRHLLW